MNPLAHARLSLMEAAGNFPSPNAQQPPGVAGLLTLVNYAAWAFTLICVVALIIAAGKLAMAHQRGEQPGTGIVMVLVAAVIGTSAGPILNAVTGG